MEQPDIVHIFQKTKTEPLLDILGQIGVGQVQFFCQVIEADLLLVIGLHIILDLKHPGIVRRHLFFQPVIVRLDHKVAGQQI